LASAHPVYSSIGQPTVDKSFVSCIGCPYSVFIPCRKKNPAESDSAKTAVTSPKELFLEGKSALFAACGALVHTATRALLSSPGGGDLCPRRGPSPLPAEKHLKFIGSGADFRRWLHPRRHRTAARETDFPLCPGEDGRVSTAENKAPRHPLQPDSDENLSVACLSASVVGAPPPLALILYTFRLKSSLYG
jgi:hypothetical protein